MTTKGTSVAVVTGLLLGTFVLSSSTSLDRNAPNGGATKLGGRDGAVWHVSTLGSDSTGDGSLPAPFSTIQNGIDHASDGDTVLVQYYMGEGKGLLGPDEGLYGSSESWTASQARAVAEQRAGRLINYGNAREAQANAFDALAEYWK